MKKHTAVYFRKHHDQYGDKVQHKEFLKEIHLKKIGFYGRINK